MRLYIGCFLPMPDNICLSLQRIINSFVKHNLPVSAERLSMDPEDGGLGIFDLKSFFQAQHCVWIKRAQALRIDNWRYDLALTSPDCNILQIKSRDLNANSNPILKYLAESYEEFYSCFSRLNGNYKEAYIFDNAAFVRGPRDTRKLDPDFFGLDFYTRYRIHIRKLTFNNCFCGSVTSPRSF